MWRRLLAHPLCPIGLPLLAVLLCLPALNVGLIGDDHIHRALLLAPQGGAHWWQPVNLFTFVDGQADHIQALKDTGRLQWWAADHIKLSFWRPLTAWTQWLDYRLWPTQPVWMHLHNVLWYGLLVALLVRLYRRLLPDVRQAHLAGFIFAVSLLHLFVVVWLAARNQLIAACCTVLAIGAFHRWRQEGRATQGALALLWVALGLLSAEAAIGALAYLAAYVLVMEAGRPWRQRVLALLPFLVLAAAWRIVYHALGHGSVGSGAYIDPGAQPLRFAEAFVQRWPTLMLAQFTGATASAFNQMGTALQHLYAGVAALVVLGLGLLGWRLRLWATPAMRFLTLGAMLSLVPVCAAEPNDRLLLQAEIGFSAVLAALFLQSLAAWRNWHGPRGWGLKGVTGLLMGVHLLLFPVLTLVSATLMHQVLAPSTQDEPLSLPDARELAARHVVLINPPAALFLYYYPVVRSDFGVASPDSIQALASGNQPLTLTTLDDHTLLLSGPKGFGDAMSRDRVTVPFHVGDVIQTSTFQVAVEALTGDGWPQTVRVRFHRPLNDADLAFFRWGDGGYVPFPLPPRGASVTLPPVNLGKLVSQRLRAWLFSRERKSPRP
jgi:hypothetical protein